MQSNGLTFYSAGTKGEGPNLVLLHGYGANGKDLLGLARLLAPCYALFPQAPIEMHKFFPHAFTWFPFNLEEFLEKDPFTLDRPPGLAEAAQQVLGALEELGLDPSQTVIGGFSQGSMVALEAVLQSQRPFKGLALFSSALLDAPHTKRLALSRTIAFFQSHGDEDPILPLAPAQRLFEVLEEAGWQGRFFGFKGGHEINDGVLKAFQEFLQSL